MGEPMPPKYVRLIDAELVELRTTKPMKSRPIKVKLESGSDFQEVWFPKKMICEKKDGIHVPEWLLRARQKDIGERIAHERSV